MEFLYYNVIQVFIGTDGELQEKTVKRTTDRRVSEDFLEIAKQLKPESTFYVSVTLEN